MSVCEICGKQSSTAGNNVSHSKRRTKRTFGANIQKVKVNDNGKETKKNVCTSCLKTLKKESK